MVAFSKHLIFHWVFKHFCAKPQKQQPDKRADPRQNHAPPASVCFILFCSVKLWFSLLHALCPHLIFLAGCCWGHFGTSSVIFGSSWNQDVPETAKHQFSAGFLRFFGFIFRPLEGHFGASWGHLGAILGPSWGHLGAFWGLLCAFWGHLGAILKCLLAFSGFFGPSWGLPGANMGHLEAC